MAAIAVDAGRSADYQRQSARRVRLSGQSSKKEQSGKRDDGAAARNGIDGAASGGGQDEREDFGQPHLRAERKDSLDQLKLRLAQRSFADAERGLAWRSAREGRMTSCEISE